MRSATVSAALLRAVQLFAVTARVGGYGRKECRVKASGTNATDDAPAILQAFEECRTNGRVVLSDPIYYVNSVMNVTGLNDVEIDIYGTLLVG